MATRSRGRAQRFNDAKLVCMYEALGSVSILQNREGKGKQGKKERKEERQVAQAHKQAREAETDRRAITRSGQGQPRLPSVLPNQGCSMRPVERRQEEGSRSRLAVCNVKGRNKTYGGYREGHQGLPYKQA